jgi:serine O-acetyltransferase
MPRIGNNCYLWIVSKILGSMTIGDNIIVIANSIVISDLQLNSIVVGISGRIILRK